MVYNIHCQLFHISRETINVVIYLFFAGYKIFWLVFNFVPLMALLIVRKNISLIRPDTIANSSTNLCINGLLML